MSEKKNLSCHWCGGSDTPFIKMNIENYGENKFLCNKCYRELEREQQQFEAWSNEA